MQKLSGPRLGLLIAATLAGMLCGIIPAAAQGFNQWGWPQPYERVSDKSIAWLKQKGWWPLAVGWQGPFSGQNTVNVVMDKAGLLEKRGLESKFQVFASGPELNEAIAAARIQVGNGGNFPFTSLLDRGIPVRAIAVVAPNLKHSTVVPLDSPVKRSPISRAAIRPRRSVSLQVPRPNFISPRLPRWSGLQIGKDVILKNMPPGEQLLMAKGIGAVVPWEPSVTIITEDRKTGREVDTIFPYNFYEGMFYVRQELIDNVPDVVQAISDAFMESTLWIRLNPDKAADFLAAEPMLKVYGKPLLLQQTQLYNNLYKPTSSYPFAKMWGEENARIAKWLKDRSRLTKVLTAKDYENSFDTQFMDKTYQKLGWKIPTQAPFIPAGWTGKIGELPYPAYANAATLKESAAVAGKG